jgi:hypothetical protein
VDPFGMTEQGSIDETVKIIDKYHLTCLSVNKRAIDHLLLAGLFGFALRRMVHYIVGCRIHYPGKRILMGKKNMNMA